MKLIGKNWLICVGRMLSKKLVGGLMFVFGFCFYGILMWGVWRLWLWGLILWLSGLFWKLCLCRIWRRGWGVWLSLFILLFVVGGIGILLWWCSWWLCLCWMRFWGWWGFGLWFLCLILRCFRSWSSWCCWWGIFIIWERRWREGGRWVLGWVWRWGVFFLWGFICMICCLMCKNC